MASFEVQEPVTDEEFSAYYRVRYETLREPWGDPVGTERADDDDAAIHRMVVDTSSSTIAGVVRLHFPSAEEAQVRLMGVVEAYRGQGLGRQLIEAMEAVAVEQGRMRMVLHARDYAVGFYEKQGYRAEGESYVLMGVIQHYFMTKSLGASPC